MKANSANSQFQIYGGKDPRGLPAYTVVEVAHYLGLPKITLRRWVRGQRYSGQQGWSRFAALIHPPEDGQGHLSFVNLTEAYVLSAIRRRHSIPLQKVRLALDCLEQQFASAHPLAEIQFQTNGVDLFAERLGQLINVSQRGQLAMRDLMREYLHRVERNEAGQAVRLFLLTRTGLLDQPRFVVIDPSLAFGRPALASYGIPTAAIADRYKAGDSMDPLAADYGCVVEAIEEAIRCELQLDVA